MATIQLVFVDGHRVQDCDPGPLRTPGSDFVDAAKRRMRVELGKKRRTVNKISLKMKLALGFGGLLFIMGAVGAIGYESTIHLAEANSKALGNTQKLVFSVTMTEAVEKQTTGVRGFLLAGTPDTLRHDQEGQTEFKEAAGELEKTMLTDEGKRLFGEIGSTAEQFRAIADQEISLKREGKSTEAEQLAFSPETTQVRNELRGALKNLGELESKLASAAVEQGHQSESETRTLILVCLTLGILLGLATATLIVRSVTTSIHQMLDLIQQIARKDLTVSHMEITSDDEIGKAGLALNQMKNGLHQLIQSISDNAQRVASASEELSVTSQHISANSEETSIQAGVVSQASQQVSQNLENVATGAQQMTTTIRSIVSSAHEAANIATNAVQTAQTANVNVSDLGASSAEIGEVIKVITSIAQQTNLLALNATIEAARAGEAGKGFAVVANEVKELAKQTAQATEDISRKITAIQTSTQRAVEAIGTIGGVISKVNNISGAIATAVEEQSTTTNDMTRSIADAAKGSAEITRNIEGVAGAVRSTSSSAQESQRAANDLAEMAMQLHGLVGQFHIDRPAAATPRAHAPLKSMVAYAGH
jgi:methyl-accepting chemotaxis protein